MYLSKSASAEAEAFRAERAALRGHAMNLDEVWALHPAAARAFLSMGPCLNETSTLSAAERAVIHLCVAAMRRDIYCSTAWGATVARCLGVPVAEACLAGREPGTGDSRLTALARWARLLAAAPWQISEMDVCALRQAGLSERDILDATLFAAYRLAFSTVNRALGASCDADLRADLPAGLRGAIDALATRSDLQPA